MAPRHELQELKSEVQAVAARGKRAIKKLKKAGRTHVRGLFAGIAKEEAVSQAQLRQAVKFATTYSTAELQAFFRLRTPSGRPLGISVAYQLMYIASRRQREAIARLAGKHGWSSREVKAEIKRRVGVDEKASKGGRRPRSPSNAEEAMRQLEEKCDQWQRWADQLEPGADEPRAFSARQLPRSIQRKIASVTSAMNELGRRVTEQRSPRLRRR